MSMSYVYDCRFMGAGFSLYFLGKRAPSRLCGKPTKTKIVVSVSLGRRV